MLYLSLTQQKPSSVLHLKSGTKRQKWQKWATEAEDKELIYVLYMREETDGAFCLSSTGRMCDFWMEAFYSNTDRIYSETYQTAA